MKQLLAKSLKIKNKFKNKVESLNSDTGKV